MTKYQVVTTTDGRQISVDITNKSCRKFGFLHGEIVIEPTKLEALILGVAPGNDGEDVLWYMILHPRTQGVACYYGGQKNLREAGFKQKF
jgi:hypothetical protein